MRQYKNKNNKEVPVLRYDTFEGQDTSQNMYLNKKTE